MNEKTRPPKAPGKPVVARAGAPARARGPKKATNAIETTPKEGERIAKVLSRRGVASRREAERLIEMGEVTVNGKVIDSPALNVTSSDRITVSGQPLPEREPVRLWLYYKPEGLVTSASDEKGRDTVFDHLPEDMPRVMSVGRLDLNSEGLLLLTNDGELKRRLELPSTGWLRKYRVRVNGTADDLKLQPLRDGITIEGERFQPMQVSIDRQQGANAWLTVGIREGRNREIRRAMNAVGLYVNRLIRTSYGPFRLNELQPGEVSEVKARVLREQLGEGFSDPGEEIDAPKPARPGARSAAAKPASGRPSGPRISRNTPRPTDEPEARPARSTGSKPGNKAADPGQRLRPGEGLARLSKAWKAATTPADEPRSERSSGPKIRRPAAADSATGGKSYSTKPRGSAPARGEAEAKPGRRPAGADFGTGTGRAPRAGGAKPYNKTGSGREGDSPRGGAKPIGAKPAAGKSFGSKSGTGKPGMGRPAADKPATGKTFGAKPASGKPAASRGAPTGRGGPKGPPRSRG